MGRPEREPAPEARSAEGSPLSEGLPALKAAGLLRADGRKGVRNVLVVAYLVECAHHVAREIALAVPRARRPPDRLSRLLPERLRARMMEQLCTHPNVGARAARLARLRGLRQAPPRARDRSVRAGRCITLGIQDTGGTPPHDRATGRAWLERDAAGASPRSSRCRWASTSSPSARSAAAPDATSGLTANPAMGVAFDLLVADGAKTIFEETGELIGMEHLMAARAANPALGDELKRVGGEGRAYYATLGYASFAPGNADGGLDDDRGEIARRLRRSPGSRRIDGIVKPGIAPPRGGLYLLDVVPDGEVRFGFPNINDNAEIAELIACGAHLILFSTGRGSVVGSAIAPVIKVCANPDTYKRMEDDMDVDAGRILEGRATLPEVGREIYELVQRVGARRADQIRGARPPGVHPHLQELRAARARAACRFEAKSVRYRPPATPRGAGVWDDGAAGNVGGRMLSNALPIAGAAAGSPKRRSRCPHSTSTAGP